MSRDRGQASVEYVAVVALVGIVMAAAVALTTGGLGGRLVWALRTGICKVGGGACPGPPPATADLPPCPLRDESSEFGTAVDVVVARLGSDLGVRTVRYSDGHADVSFGKTDSHGLRVGLGVKLRVPHVSLNTEGTAGVDWSVAAGQTWRFSSAAAASRFVKRYGGRQKPLGSALDAVRHCLVVCRLVGLEPAPLPPADATSYEHGTGVKLDAEVLGGLLAGGAADLNRRMLGSTVDRDGTSSVFLSTTNALRASTLAGFGAGSDVAHSGVVELDLDRHDTPTAIVLHGLRRLAASDDAAAGRLEQTDVALADPTPTDLRGVRLLLGGGLPGADSIGDLTALLSDLRRGGVTTARTYALSTGGGAAGAEVDAGVGVGFEVSGAHASLRLLGATTQVPGLPALPRDDCRTAGA